MLRNYLTIAWRNLIKQKLYSAINVLGLTVGLSCFLLIFVYLQDEFTADRFFTDYEKIYRFSYVRNWENGTEQAMATSGGTWGPRYTDLFPGVTQFARLAHTGYPGFVNRLDAVDAFMEPKFYFVDSTFLDLLDFPLKAGNQKTVLSRNDYVIISESTAKKYFGDKNAVGEILEFTHNIGTIPLTVSGIFYDAPGSSHLQPDFLASLNGLNQLYLQRWNYNALTENSDAFMFTYLKIEDNATIPKIKADWENFIKEALANDTNNNADEYQEAKFTALADMHFEPEMKWELEAPADASYVPIFIISALLVLMIACINFMNLATARSAKRAREVGLRKTMGSTKSQLIAQFFGESFLIASISVVISFILVILLLPYFNDLSGKELALSLVLAPTTLLSTLTLIFVVGVISGIYPALYLSNFRPIAALRGISSSGKSAEGMRRGLVVFQFSVSIILIISTLVVYQQLDLIHGSKLGEDKDRILSIRLGGFGLGDGWRTFREEIEQDSRFESVTLANHLPRLPHFGLINRNFKFPERDNEELEWNKFDVDFNFPKTFKLEFVAGRDFDASIRSDSNAIILNESAVQSLGQEAHDLIGLTIRDRVWNNQLQQQVDLDGKVIGVVKDFPYKSVKSTIEPLAIWGTPSQWDRIMYVKMTPGNYLGKIEALQDKWKSINAGFPMENWFLDFEFGRLYENERRMSGIFSLFSAITIFIAILGLFALASYVTEQRKKEIGIRKVLGASSENLVKLLLIHFFKLIAIAFLISVPVAWYLMDSWLSEFVYRVGISASVILIAGAAVSLVTFLTVGFDTYRTAMANPVKVLRTE